MGRLQAHWLLGIPTVALVAACYVGPVEGDGDTGATAGGRSAGAANDGGRSGAQPVDVTGEGGLASTGLPCDVAAIIERHCGTCHGARPSAPMALIRPSDFTRVASTGGTVAQAAVVRMRDDGKPMPPAPLDRVAPADIDLFEAWVSGGMKAGACGEQPSADGGAAERGDGGGPAANVACSSGRYWPGKRKGTEMNPGRACISCHESSDDDGPSVQLGGTVYPTLHEEDLCLGVDGTQSPTDVVVTDAQGRVFTMPVGPTGNFAWPAEQAPVTFPIRAKVVSGGRERAMATPQRSGDCNSCHTQGGRNGAPGRILAP
jgi:mono/diheme cytochrome c family protein